MREVFQGVRGELAETKVVGPTIMLPLCVVHKGEHFVWFIKENTLCGS